MSKIEDAKEILKDLELPKAQQNEMSALTLLALCNLKEKDKWNSTKKISVTVTKGIMSFIKENYNKEYAPNTRETFRRNVLHQFVHAGIIDYNPDNPKLAVNSPKAHYSLTDEAINIIRLYKTKDWQKSISFFIKNKNSIYKKYLQNRELKTIPLKLSKELSFKLSAGKHNELQAGIIKLFAPRFAKKGIVLYLGDTAKKYLHVEKELLNEFNIPINEHSKLPDVIIYDSNNKWLFLIEAVTSHGPISNKRKIELEQLLSDCNLGKIYVTAFLNFNDFKKYSSNIAWETEIWLMDTPDHLIHFNGDRFFGPR